MTEEKEDPPFICKKCGTILDTPTAPCPNPKCETNK